METPKGTRYLKIPLKKTFEAYQIYMTFWPLTATLSVRLYSKHVWWSYIFWQNDRKFFFISLKISQMHQLITYKSKGSVKNRALVKFFAWVDTWWEKTGRATWQYICVRIASTFLVIFFSFFYAFLFHSRIRLRIWESLTSFSSILITL